jgi:hypothetical protein
MTDAFTSDFVLQPVLETRPRKISDGSVGANMRHPLSGREGTTAPDFSSADRVDHPLEIGPKGSEPKIDG